MTKEQAQTAANVIIAVAAAGVALAVVRQPRLRRVVWQMARQYAAGPLAAWTATTVRDAWEESAPLQATGDTLAGISPPQAPSTSAS